MTITRRIYRVARSVLFSAILVVAGLYLLVYVLLSVPPVQNTIKNRLEKEASAYIGSTVRIDGLDIRPFNEVVVSGLSVSDREGRECLYVETLGAGITLWRLIRDGKLEFSYGEIIGLKANVVQDVENGPLNIGFIIEAFQPKDKNKPPTPFDVQLRNVVIRRSSLSFSREWKPRVPINDKTDFNHFRLTNLKADLNLPQLKNDDFIIDLRRLSFDMSGGLKVEKLALQTHITPYSISVNNLVLSLPATELRPSDIALNFNGFNNITEALKSGEHRIIFLDNKVSPSDFGWLMPSLRKVPGEMSFTLEAAGNLNSLSINRLDVSDERDLSIRFSAEAESFLKPEQLHLNNVALDLNLGERSAVDWLALLPDNLIKIKKVVTGMAPLSLTVKGKGDMAEKMATGECLLSSGSGVLKIDGTASNISKSGSDIKAEVMAQQLEVGRILDNPLIGNLSAEINIDGRLKGKDSEGSVVAVVNDFAFKGIPLGGMEVEVEKIGKEIHTVLSTDNILASLDASADLIIAGQESRLLLDADISSFNPSLIGWLPKYGNYVLEGKIRGDLSGNSPDNMAGEIEIDDFRFSRPQSLALQFNRLTIKTGGDQGNRSLALRSDWFDFDMEGDYRFASLPNEMHALLHSVFPSLIDIPPKKVEFSSSADFSLLIHPDNSLTEFFRLPVRLLVPITLGGTIDGELKTATLALDVPYLQQGKNKLLRDNRLVAQLDGADSSFSMEIASTFPAKKGDMSVNAYFWGQNENIHTDVSWITPENTDFKGRVSFDATLIKNQFSRVPEVDVEIKPSIFDAGTAQWNIADSRLSYREKALSVEGLRISHDGQFVAIDGVASANPEDSLSVKLAGIDLGYIFDTLNINYVTFGGVATGEITGRNIFTPVPEALTDNLKVDGLSYNGALLGDGLIKSRWLNNEKEVEIKADITDQGHLRAKVDGGIWITRDSLSFAIDADKVPVNFLRPFMSAFSSDVSGFASGKAKLYGTFSDIDLVGSLYADSLSIKLDYTNTYYHGSDSVFLHPGRIEIPSFRLYDRDGNSALLSGSLTHRFFHDPSFNFRLSDARHLLCYDTNAKLNPDWYGTVYGNGSAIVRGWPGVVSVTVDMSLVGNSAFTFVLNETEAAQDYHFLTFSDRRKEESEKSRVDSVPDVLAMFRKKMDSNAGPPSNFILDLRASVTPSSLFTLVMDPVAGDKITARGNGAMQMTYDTESDQLKMLGKYTLEEGNYNFSLQDLILKDFTIRQGSSIAFNGDPMNAMLDITASYRVNTNLSDLDKSFADDRELTRTNVPVDALLMVKGEMQHPDITFDIELPTLTQDVTRKVKSIISTDDMMSRQIIYLLALNRFYTPEYMGSTSNGGGELAAVASSTLSSQLSNMIGQLTDKFTLSPSFRSDKGDFSDVEFDVALSSRLLNNRLLINGNFGYRDRNTSTTTFVGDFDIEYLLNRSGQLRLKAYNHFNDQNYYLREALTTQGLGIVFRKDFDDAFKWLRPRKENKLLKNGKSEGN